MHEDRHIAAEQAAAGDVPDGIAPGEPDLLRRWGRHQAFWDARLAARLDPTARVAVERIGPAARVMMRSRDQLSGVNFASQDHLSLASHPDICEAAAAAIRAWGVHGAGAANTQGASLPVLMLEERLAELLCCREAAVFPSGWTAGYGAVRAILREGDHVVIDCLARSCFQDAAVVATRNLHRVPHCSPAAVEARLAQLRAADSQAGILVVTESVFALTSAMPDLQVLRMACRAYGATLLIGLGHDLGASGDGGLGALGAQGLLGEADIVTGSLAHAFATNGGFVAGNASGLRPALQTLSSTLPGSATLSPMQASVALAALKIIRSAEGAKRRKTLAANVQRLREGLRRRAFEVLGTPSAVVPMILGDVRHGRLMTREALDRGALVNLVEHPAVAHSRSQWPLLVMADHATEHLNAMVRIAVEARERAHAPAWPDTGPAKERPGPTS